MNAMRDFFGNVMGFPVLRTLSERGIEYRSTGLMGGRSSSDPSAL
jgi:hypothetical protein